MTINELFEQDQFAKHTGIELLEAGKGYAKARMEIKTIHLNAGGVCQGGVLFTLADFAFAVASNSHGVLTFSITSSINIFRSEKSGYLYATAKEVFNHKKISNCEVQITNENGELVATFNGNGYRKDIQLPFEPI